MEVEFTPCGLRVGALHGHPRCVRRRVCQIVKQIGFKFHGLLEGCRCGDSMDSLKGKSIRNRGFHPPNDGCTGYCPFNQFWECFGNIDIFRGAYLTYLAWRVASLPYRGPQLLCTWPEGAVSLYMLGFFSPETVPSH